MSKENYDQKKVDLKNFKYVTYIHSHASSLAKLDFQHENLILKSNRIIQNTVDNMKTTADTLRTLSSKEVVKDWYEKTHYSDGKRKMDNDLESIVKKIEKARDAVPKNIDTLIQKIVQKIFNSPSGTIAYDKIIDSTSQYVADHMIDYLTKKDSTISWKTITIQELENNQEIYSLLAKSLTYNLTGYFKGRDILKVEKIITNYLNAINAVATAPSNTEAQALQKMIESRAVAGDEFAQIIASGSLLEYFMFLFLNKNKVSIGKQTFSLTGTSEHLLTTDVQTIIDDGIEKHRIGISLKANLTKSFIKTVKLDRESENPFDLTQEDYTKMLYVLGNYKALSIFAAPDKYDTVLTKNGDPKIPTNKKIALPGDMFEWALLLQKSWTYLALVKGLIGQLFNIEPNFKGNDDLKAPPLFLGFLEYDYYMSDILDNLIQIVTLQPDKWDSFIEYTELTWKSWLFNNAFKKQLLTDLFLAKKITESKTDNRYLDFYIGEIDEEEASKARMNSQVMNILDTISSNFNIEKLQSKLFNTVRYNIAISELIK